MKRVLVTGGSGFIGHRLVAELLLRGDRVTVLTRDVMKTRRAFPPVVRVAAWEPTKEGAWQEELGVVDAVVHLAGEPVAQRWNDDVKKRIESSRVTSTRLVVEGIAKAKKKPEALICASATGYYGPRKPDEELDETSAPGNDFLANVVKKWEAEAKKAKELGVRDVEVRFGVVFGDGGALEKMAAPFRFFAGGPIGKGDNVVPWVHRDDVVGILLLALDDATLEGPINATSPNPCTGVELARAIGEVMNRPAWFRTPPALLRVAFGEATDVLTTSQRVIPKRAIEKGYEFRFVRLVPAIESVLAPS